MVIQSITYDKGFRLKFRWVASVEGTIIYAVPKGAPLLDTQQLVGAVMHGKLKQLGAISYNNGTSSVSFMPPQKEYEATWVDICECDYSGNYLVLRHERVKTCFNGACTVHSGIEYIPISSQRRAVQITIHNRSKFPIEANGIGYSVNGRVFGIPMAISSMERRVLPQFDVGEKDVVKLCEMENSYPVVFRDLNN